MIERAALAILVVTEASSWFAVAVSGGGWIASSIARPYLDDGAETEATHAAETASANNSTFTDRETEKPVRDDAVSPLLSNV